MDVRTVDSVMVERQAAAIAELELSAEAVREGARMALSMVDLTTLEGKDTPQRVRGLCRKAIRPWDGGCEPGVPSVAAVCVYPALVAVAKEELAGTEVKVASVATAFPSGQFPLEARLADVRGAVNAGADEIDMVINRGAFLSGQFDVVADEIRQVKQACGGAHLKVILETGELETYDNIRRASDLAIEAPGSLSSGGELFIKTSTGKIPGVANLPTVLVMLQAIRDHYLATEVRIGMKPAGGIKTARDAVRYLALVKETLDEAWLSPRLFRFGASGVLDDLVRAIVG